MLRFARLHIVLVALVALAVGIVPRIALADATLGWIEIRGPLLETPDPYAALTGGGSPTLLDMVDALHAAAERDDLDAVVIRLRDAKMTTSQVEELGEAMLDLRSAGKKVHLFTEIYGPAELVLGSYADEVIMQTGGAISLPGLHVEEMFLADALNWLGLKMDYVQIGAYKGAKEQLGNNGPSKEWAENFSQLLDSLYGAMRHHLMEGRHLSDRRLDDAMESAWFSSGAEAIDHGLIDAEIDRLDLPKHLEEAYGGDITYVTNLGPKSDDGIGADALSNPFALFETLMQEPDNGPTRNSIALLDIDGAIIDGESKAAGPFGGASVGSLTIRESLKKIEDESLIKGVVIRINSPGGSAIASESIWRGIHRVAEKKPVWVSVGSMAASGGYYIAVGGSKIYLDSSSIVGSIGVVGGKLVRGGAYDKLRINVVPHDRGPAANLMSTLEPWTDAQRKLVRDRMTETYDVFVGRVEAGRPGINIDKTAEGRLFAGEKAIDMGLADQIGGLRVAITDLADDLGLADGKYDVLHYPGALSLQKLLQNVMGRFGLSAPGVANHSSGNPLLTAAAAGVRELVGLQSWSAFQDSANAMLQLRREPVLLTSPRVLLFR